MKYIHYLLLSCISITMCACNQSADNSVNDNEQTSTDAADNTHNGLTTVKKVELEKVKLIKATDKIDEANKDETTSKAKRLNESLSNAFAYNANESKIACPKLLVRNIDQNSIQRVDDKMQGDYCDYYLYPTSGSKISVWSNNDDVKINLISPKQIRLQQHKTITIDSNQRHTIRVQYNGTSLKTPNFTYHLEVDFQ